jgi:hypothetical protein
MWTVVILILTIFGVIGFYALKMFVSHRVGIEVNNRVEKEIDDRLLELLSNNRPIFSAIGESIATDNKINLSNTITGIDQLNYDTLLVLDVYPEKVSPFPGQPELTGSINIENGALYIKISGYDQTLNKSVHWHLIWARTKYIK